MCYIICYILLVDDYWMITEPGQVIKAMIPFLQR